MGGKSAHKPVSPTPALSRTSLGSPFGCPKRSLLATHRVRPSQVPENIPVGREPQADLEREETALAQLAPRRAQTGTKVRGRGCLSRLPARLPACPPACQAKCPRSSPRCHTMLASVISVPAGSPIAPDPCPRPRWLGSPGRSKGSGTRQLRNRNAVVSLPVQVGARHVRRAV